MRVPVRRQRFLQHAGAEHDGGIQRLRSVASEPRAAAERPVADITGLVRGCRFRPAPGDGRHPGPVRGGPRRLRHQCRPPGRTDDAGPVLQRFGDAAAAVVLAQRPAGSVDLAARQRAEQDRLGRSHRRPDSHGRGRTADGDQCLAVWHQPVPGGRRDCRVRDGPERTVAVRGLFDDPGRHSLRAAAGIPAHCQRDLRLDLRARFCRRAAARHPCGGHGKLGDCQRAGAHHGVPAITTRCPVADRGPPDCIPRRPADAAPDLLRRNRRIRFARRPEREPAGAARGRQ